MITSSRLDSPVYPARARDTGPPRLVPSWYIVCASRDLRPGAVIRFELDGQPIAIFRGRDTGVIHALPAHCQHQGVDLTRGDVVGDRLRCPLHHWEYSDRCEKIPGQAPIPRLLGQNHYRIAERFGMIFLYLGSDPAWPIPGFSVDDGTLSFRSGAAITVDCPWYVPVTNAFDMAHLQTVHRRVLTSVPEISFPDATTFRVDYSTAVTGDGWSDRTMRLLSGNNIRVKVTVAGGTVVLVESSIRNWRGYLMASFRPIRNGVSILPIFGVPRRSLGLHRLYARLSAALFSAFLSRDVHVLGGIRFPSGFADTNDAVITACYRYLCQLPEYGIEESS